MMSMCMMMPSERMMLSMFLVKKNFDCADCIGLVDLSVAVLHVTSEEACNRVKYLDLFPCISNQLKVVLEDPRYGIHCWVEIEIDPLGWPVLDATCVGDDLPCGTRAVRIFLVKFCHDVKLGMLLYFAPNGQVKKIAFYLCEQ